MKIDKNKDALVYYFTAKEMFENLGYKQNKGYYWFDYETNIPITLPELKAINKQIEELGW